MATKIPSYHALWYNNVIHNRLQCIHIQMFLKKQNIRPLSVEGAKDGHWVLLDYGHVIIHIFYESMRRFYDLEGLWVDAKRIKTESIHRLEKERGETIGDDS